MRPPKWLRRPCGVSFGFGGTLAFFNEKAGSTIAAVVTDDCVVARSRLLQTALETRQLTSYCASKAANATTDRDAREWSLMQVLCSQEQVRLRTPLRQTIPARRLSSLDWSRLSAQRLLLLQYLGLEEEPLARPPMPAGDADGDPAAIFSALAVQQDEANEASDAAAATAVAEDEAMAGDDKKAANASPVKASLQLKLNRAILKGNFDEAVACCLEFGRVADALVLAASGGPELWTQTRDMYLASTKSPFISTLSAVVHQDFAKYVMESDLARWKETLGLLNTYATPEELSSLCNMLGERLEDDPPASTLCYMCAANVAQATTLWESYHAPSTEGNGDSSSLIEIMEKLSVFQEAAQTKEGFALIAQKVTTFAETLTSQGCLLAAMHYLLSLPVSELGGEAALLRERIYGLNSTLLASPPPPPFPVTHVEVSPDTYFERTAAEPTAESEPSNYPSSTFFGETAQPQQEQLQSTHSTQPTYAPPRVQPGHFQTQDHAPTQLPAHHTNSTIGNGHGVPQPTYAPPPTATSFSYAPPPTQPTHARSTPSHPPPSAHPVATSTYAATVPAAAPAPAPAPSYTYSAPLEATPSTPAYAYTPQTQTQTYGGGCAQPNAATVEQPLPSAVPPPQPSYDPEPVVNTLSQLADTCGTFNLPPLEQRKVEDIKKRLGLLTEKLRSGAISSGVFDKLHQLCTALGSGDARIALELHVQITTSDWSDNGPWLMGVKRLIEMTSKLGVSL